MGGGQSSSTNTIIGIKGILLISYYNIDLPASQSQQTMRVSEETTINQIIQQIKVKFDCENVTLYYEETPLDDLLFLQIYEYLDLLPKRSFGYRINQIQQQNAKVTQSDIKYNQKINQQYQSQIIPTNQNKPQGEAQGQDISDQKQQFKTPLNNNSNFSQQKYGSLIVVPSQNKQEPIENQHINEGDNQKQDKSYLLTKLLKHIQQKYIEVKQQGNQFKELLIKNKQLETENSNMKENIKEMKFVIDSLQKGYNNVKQQIEELQHQNKNPEDQLQKYLNKNDLVNTTIQSIQSKDPSIIMINQSQTIEKQQKLQNKCGHYLDEEKIQNMLKESLKNRTIAYCDQCKPTKILSQILLKSSPLGIAYKEFQANEELKQLIINLKSQKTTICKCSRNNCTFFCIFNKSNQITTENSFCPLCLLRGMKISE